MTDPSASSAAAANLVSALSAAPRPLRLRGTIQPYAWGGDEFLPRLAGLEPSAGRPAAELWLGAHPVAPAVASLGEYHAPLDAVVAAGPRLVLGDEVAARFDGTLPYLLKVLDVRVMLSIQAHPTRDQARAGFARENALGVPIEAPHRVYRDPNHKPEMQVALGEFWMLYGFRPLAEVVRDVARVPELAALVPGLTSADAAAGWSPSEEESARRRLFTRLMALPQEDVDRALGPLARRLQPLYEQGVLDKESPDFWAARAFEQLPLPGGHIDRGIVSIYLLNLVHLDAGDATFVPAGVLHAYLEGRNVELMAASDNVLRGGLTPKHVDVEELSRIVKFDTTPPGRLRPAIEQGRSTFCAPVDEFLLERLELPAGFSTTVRRDLGPTTILVIEGCAAITPATGTMTPGEDDAKTAMTLDRGGAALVPASWPYVLRASSDSVVFVATVPPRLPGLRT